MAGKARWHKVELLFEGNEEDACDKVRAICADYSVAGQSAVVPDPAAPFNGWMLRPDVLARETARRLRPDDEQDPAKACEPRFIIAVGDEGYYVADDEPLTRSLALAATYDSKAQADAEAERISRTWLFGEKCTVLAFEA